jgi:hypothetical protein
MRENCSVSAKEECGNMAPSSVALLDTVAPTDGGRAARLDDLVTASFRIFWASFQC